jgi:hypothetical protein
MAKSIAGLTLLGMRKEADRNAPIFFFASMAKVKRHLVLAILVPRRLPLSSSHRFADTQNLQTK